jgi:sporulation protein YlmC with PRC-barrel domain
MSEAAEFVIGAEVSCDDSACGELRRVVVDPIKRAITHLVVEPRHREGMGHLVPIDLVETTTGQEIRLRCTWAQFEALEDAEETKFLPGARGQWGYQQNQMFSMPFFGLGGMGMGGMGLGGMGMGGMGMGMGGMGMGGMGLGGMGMGAGPQAVTYDKVPAGEVEVRRGQRVHASDGPIGRIQGLVVDAADHHVTHVLLDEGHLWGRKEVSIPISAVTGVDDGGVRLSLTKDEVGDLPPVELQKDE